MVNKVKYEVMRKVGNIEIRRYPSIILAYIDGHADNDSFRILFNYIQGSNRSKRKVSMTAPVISSEEIPMTSPVISAENTFSFVLLEEFTLENAPVPIDSNISIKQVPSRTLAVLGFSGRVNERLLSRKNEELVLTLKANKILFKGPPLLMRYNSPFMPGPFRKNEVALEISG